MSDALPPEIIEAAKLRDQRFRDLDLSIEVETGLRDGKPLFELMAALRTDADLAMAEFAHANCADVTLMQDLQSRVFRFRYAIETLDRILDRGRTAEFEIRTEDSLGVRED